VPCPRKLPAAVRFRGPLHEPLGHTGLTFISNDSLRYGDGLSVFLVKDWERFGQPGDDPVRRLSRD
jgi:hypothetical protein